MFNVGPDTNYVYFITVVLFSLLISGCYNPIEKELRNYAEINELLEQASHYRHKEKDYIRTEEYEKKALDKMMNSYIYRVQDYLRYDGRLIAHQKIGLASAMLMNDKSLEANELLLTIKNPSEKLKGKDDLLYSAYLYNLSWCQYDLKQYKLGDANIQEAVKVLEESEQASPELIAFVKRGYEQIKNKK